MERNVWLDVKERLPVCGIKVLCKDEKDRPFVGILYSDSEPKFFIYPHNGECRYAVKWCLIPEDN